MLKMLIMLKMKFKCLKKLHSGQGRIDETPVLKVAYNSIFRRVLSYRRNESVTDVRNYFGYDDWDTLVTKRREKFARRLRSINNDIIRSFL